MLTIEIDGIPLCDPPAGMIDEYQNRLKRHLDVRLTMDQGIALRRLLLGLDAHNARLRDGRRVLCSADVIRWLLDQLDPPANVIDAGQMAAATAAAGG